MVQFFRMVFAALRAFRARRLTLLEPSELSIDVGISDLDVFGHVTNSRYLALMNLGRLDLAIRCGWGREAFRLRTPMVVGSILIRYQAPLLRGQRVSLRSRVLGWDDRWVYLEQTMHSGDRVYTLALVRAAFKGAAGRLTPASLFECAGLNTPSPPLPGYLTRLTEVETDWYRQRESTDVGETADG